MRTIFDCFKISKSINATGVFDLGVDETDEILIKAMKEPDLGFMRSVKEDLFRRFSESCSMNPWFGHGGSTTETMKCIPIREACGFGFKFTLEPEEGLTQGQQRAFEKRLLAIKFTFEFLTQSYSKWIGEMHVKILTTKRLD